MAEVMVGADVTGLRSLAGLFDRSADTLTRSMGLLTSSVASVGRWTGPDANRFRATWASSCRPALTRAIGELHAAAENARSNADEQERASAGGGTAGASAVGIGGSADGSLRVGEAVSLWDRLKEDARRSFETYDSAKKIWDLNKLGDLPKLMSARSIERAIDQLQRSGQWVDTPRSPFAEALRRVSPKLGAHVSAQAFERGLQDLTRTGDDVIPAENAMERVVSAAGRPFSEAQRLTGPVEDGFDALRDSGAGRVGSAARVVGHVGTGLSIIGLGADEYQTITSVQDGHYRDAVGHAMDVTTDVLIMSGPENPLFYPAIAYQGGKVVYEYRHEIADGAGWAADRSGDAAGWAYDKGGDAVGALGGGAKSAAKKLKGWL